MGIKEVTALRKQGKLKEAYDLAKADLEQDPTNIFNKRSLAWVYFEYLKNNAVAEKCDNFISILDKIVELNLPEIENMFFDYSGGQIVKLIFSMLKEEKAALKKHAEEGFICNFYSKEFISRVDVIFQRVRNFHFSKPSESYSFILRAFFASLKDTSYFVDFAEFWDFENLTSADMESQIMSNGKRVISVGEQALITYCKLLLHHKFSESETENSNIRREKIETFLPKIEAIDKKFPTLQFVSYYRAKLLIEIGDRDNVLKAFLPFAQRKRNLFWIWDILSDVFSANDNRKLACLCKALTCQADDEYLVKIRQKLAELLVESNLFVEAKTEIENIVDTRSRNKWALSQAVKNWQSQLWYSKAISKPDNTDFYKTQVELAESILYADIKEVAVVVEFVNRDKKIVNYVANRELHGFFNYENLVKQVQIGDILLIRISKHESNGRTNVLSARFASKEVNCEAVKYFSNTLKIIPELNIGFVDDSYVSSQMVENHKLVNGQSVKGKAVLSFNKTKNVWGWKVFEIL